MFLQPTSPLRKVKDIKKVLEIIKKKYDSVWSISPINFKNHYKKQLLIKNNKLRFAYPKGDKILARQQLGKLTIVMEQYMLSQEIVS